MSKHRSCADAGCCLYCTEYLCNSVKAIAKRLTFPHCSYPTLKIYKKGESIERPCRYTPKAYCNAGIAISIGVLVVCVEDSLEENRAPPTTMAL